MFFRQRLSLAEEGSQRYQFVELITQIGKLQLFDNILADYSVVVAYKMVCQQFGLLSRALGRISCLKPCRRHPNGTALEILCMPYPSRPLSRIGTSSFILDSHAG